MHFHLPPRLPSLNFPVTGSSADSEAQRIFVVSMSSLAKSCLSLAIPNTKDFLRDAWNPSPDLSKHWRSNKELSELLPSLVWGVTQSQGSHVCPAAFCRRKSVVDSMLNTSVASVNSIQSQCPRIRKGDLTFFHKKCCFLLIY